MEDLPEGGRSVAKIGRERGINERVAHRWWKNYEETGELRFKKTSRITGRPTVFTDSHKYHVMDLLDEDSQTTIADVLEKLT